jgi:3-hydroxyisobutyrate dehydrogenase-like beta-hydroxyacid dehydrogenase
VTLGFVGLGAMGGRMAKRLLDAGRPLVGYNRTAARAQWLVDAGLVLAPSPRDVAARADVVFTMVADTAALRAVSEGPDGIVAGLRAGATWVEMSTVAPALTRELGGAALARGATMIDAPVSGSVATLEQGTLAFMVGGDPAALARVRPYLLDIGPTITHVGELGLAVTMKIATNLELAVQLLAFCESVALAEKAGIARERAVEVLLKSVVASPMLKYRGPFVLGLPEEAWFNVAMMQKDLELAMELGRATGVPLATVALAHEMLTAARGRGLAEWDFAVVFDVIARLAGLPPAPKPPASHR